MVKDQQFLKYIQDEKQCFSGWDFSFITATGRMQSELLSWSYGSMAIPLVQTARSMLDMGTGGGEFLSKLAPFPSNMFATESYKPNIAIAKQRLEPLGIKVVSINEDADLPFEDHFFDCILNQHESFSSKEVRRILKDNGIFLTQQVGGFDCYQINESFGVPLNEEYSSWNLKAALEDLKNNHFEVLDCKEEFPIQRFYDIGALIYYLKAIPWQVPSFTTDRYLEQLYEIHQIIQSNGYFGAKQHRFIVKTRAI
ncbi:SAM-dependent methyltransferase [Bacillaceae bacterium SAS-127]|nr:SAM-dependent methyltransferase [Bacillaceae bacterium SAS-127]